MLRKQKNDYNSVNVMEISWHFDVVAKNQLQYFEHYVVLFFLFYFIFQEMKMMKVWMESQVIILIYAK